VVGVATAVAGMGVIAMGRMRIVARVVGVTAIGSVGFVIRVVDLSAVIRVDFVACVVAVASAFGLGVVVHVGGVRVRLGRSAVVLVAGVVAVRLVVVLVVRLWIGPGVAVGSVSGVVHVFPIDDESGIRIMVEAPAGGTRFAAIGARHRSPIQLYPRGVCMKPLYTPGGYRRQGVAMRTTPAGPRHERRGPAGARQITGGP
jgi:hypothetical protein